MNRLLSLLICALVLAGAASAQPDKGSAPGKPEGRDRRQGLPIPSTTKEFYLDSLAWPHAVPVKVASGDNAAAALFAFPVWGLEIAEVSNGGPMQPLFMKDGTVQLPSGNELKIHITLRDFLKDPQSMPLVRKEIKEKFGKEALDPSMDDEFLVALTAGSGSPEPLGLHRLTREYGPGGRRVCEFNVVGQDKIKLLSGCSAKDLRLTITAHYDAIIEEVAFKASASYARSKLLKMKNDFATSEGRQPVLVVSVGGDGQASKNVTDKLLDEVDVEFSFRKGAKVDPAIVKALIDAALADANATGKDWAIGDKDLVGFSLGGQLNVTCALGQVSEVADALDTLTEDKLTKEDFEKRRDELKVKASGGGWGFNFNGEFETMSEREKKEFLDQFCKKMRNAKKDVKGKLATLSPISMKQLDEVVSEKMWRKRLEVKDWEFGLRTVQMPYSLGLLTGQAQPVLAKKAPAEQPARVVYVPQPSPPPPPPKKPKLVEETKTHTISVRRPKDWRAPNGGEHYREEWQCPDGWKIYKIDYQASSDPGFTNPGGAAGWLYNDRKGGYDPDYDILDDGRRAIVYRRIGVGGFTMNHIISYKRTVTVFE